jgi:hypothetical protein
VKRAKNPLSRSQDHFAIRKIAPVFWAFFFIAWAGPWSLSVRHISLYSPNGSVFRARNGLKKSGKIVACAFRWVFENRTDGGSGIGKKGGFAIPSHAFCTRWLSKEGCWVTYRFRSIFCVEFNCAKISTPRLQLPGEKGGNRC